jgi:hypothetical protein
MGNWQRAMVAAAALELTANDALAADRAALAPRIERVALFKNGVGYFTSSVTLPEKATTVTLGSLPVPALGTFWVGHSRQVGLRGLFTSLVDVGGQVPAPDLARLLLANIGRRVRISTNGDAAETVEGVVLSSVPPTEPVEPPSPYVMEVRRELSAGIAEGGGLVAIRTDRGIVVLSPGSIRRVDLEGHDATTTVPRALRRPTVRVELEKAAPGEKLDLSYLARGITWSPSYRIDLSDPRTARLTASAMVVNEVADLDGVELELVTGFPNVQFANVASPIAMSQPLAEFLNALRRAGRETPDAMDSPLAQQFTLSNVASFGSDARGPAYSVATAGEATEDLFFYPVEKLSLKRGETAHLTLFSADAPYEHIYAWRIRDSLDEDERNRSDRQPPPVEEVWHSCRLTNPLKMPLTTAPTQFVKDGQFVGQDIGYYTAPGAETTIRINRAMNVVAEQTEFEVERKRDAGRFYGSSYDLVTIRGELKLRNRMDRAAALEVTKELSGEVTASVPPAKDTSVVKGLRRVNTRHTLVWKLDLEPATERKLGYSYDVYVRN